MTPPPSDADKPGSGGPKPGGTPAPVTPTDPAPADSKPGAKSPAPSVGGVKPLQGNANEASNSTPGPAAGALPKPVIDPVGNVKLGSAEGARPVMGTPARPGDGKVEGPQTGATGSSAPEIAKTTSTLSGTKTEPGKPESGKIDIGKVDIGKTEAAKPGAGNPGQPGAGSQSGGGPRPGAASAAAVTAGPILDLKAKRIPDPPASGREPAKDGTAKDASKDASKDGPKETLKGAVPGAAAPTVGAPPAARSGAGFGSLAAAGLLGGLIGAGALFGVEHAGIGGGFRPNAADPTLSGQVASLDKRVDGLAPRDALADLDKRVAAAESAARQALEKNPAPGSAPADGASASPGSAVPADLAARLDSLDQRVAALQEEPGRDPSGDAKLGVAQAGDPKQIADLDARVKALEADQPSKGEAAETSKKLAALQGDVEQRTKANAEADASVAQRIDTLQQTLDARVKAATEAVQAATQASRTAAEAGQAQAAEATKAVDRRLQEQADKIAALDKSVAQRAEISTVQAALRVVVADRVAAALAAGMPYAEPLATLRKLDPGAEAQAAALAPFAETGAPTTAQLANAFQPVAEQIAAKRRSQRAKNAAETGDFRTKLLSMADGIVQVRKVDAPAAPEASDDPEAKVQAALDRGDLPAASAAFAALPSEARDQAGDFAGKLKARAAADEAMRTLLAGAFKALPTDPASGAAPTAAPGR